MHSVLDTINIECSTFLIDSCGQPLYRLLPITYSDFQKVKVRHKQRTDIVGEVFNMAFDTNIRARAVFASSRLPQGTAPDLEPFLIFPIDGYRYLYSSEVTDSNYAYRQVMETLIGHMDNEVEAAGLTADILKTTYRQTGLADGISRGSEIILYNIPYYYAIRARSMHPTILEELYNGT